MRKTRIQVLLTPEEAKQLEELAAARGLTKFALLRSLMLEAVKKNASIGGQTTTPPMEIIDH